MTLLQTAALPTHESLRLAEEAGLEFVNGQVLEQPVSIESSRIGMRVGRLLSTEAEKTRAAEVYDSSLGYKVYPDEPEKFRKPDVSVIRAERLTGIDPIDGFMRIPADLVVEVLSPGDLAYDVAAKVDEYLKYNFGLVWVVQPNTHSVAIYRPDGSAALLHAQDFITGEKVLPGFRCEVREFFARSAVGRPAIP